MHTWKLFAAAQGLCTALSKVHPHCGQEEEAGHCGDAQPIRGLQHCLEALPSILSGAKLLLACQPCYLQ